MISSRRLVTLSGIVIFVTVGMAATRLPNKPRNLKVLPGDISNEMLDSIMHSYNKALGVNCSFCHAPYKNIPDSLNYELDENPRKEEARKMMRLTIAVNKGYFYYDSAQRPEYLKVVTCITCHRGDPMPADLK
ncbi:MAG: c-type cytochrome [Bacteroidota bacterium]|nr:c-type cytochrome [Bacteroidota bacterium]